LWILRITGCFLIIICTTFFGIIKAGSLKKRVASINGIILCLEKISQYIKLENYDKEQILQKALPEDFCLSEYGVYADKKACITAEDEGIINEFFSELGMWDGEYELKRCASYKNILKKQLEKAEKEETEKYKLFSVGGFLFGVVFSVLWW